MKKLFKGILLAIASLIVIAAVLLIISSIRSRMIQDDYSSVYADERYQTPIMIDNVDVIKQDISCGYAVIEMFGARNGCLKTSGIKKDVFEL